jgi:hypothetical protein
MIESEPYESVMDTVIIAPLLFGYISIFRMLYWYERDVNLVKDILKS